MNMMKEERITTEEMDDECEKLLEKLQKKKATIRELEKKNNGLKDELVRYKEIYDVIYKKVEEEFVTGKKIGAEEHAFLSAIIKKVMVINDKDDEMKAQKQSTSSPAIVKTQIGNDDVSHKKEKIKVLKQVAEGSTSSPATVKTQIVNDDVSDDNDGMMVLKKENNVTKDRASISAIDKTLIFNDEIDGEDDKTMVPIGPNAKVHKRVLKSINWHSYTDATRKILVDVFTRRELATHSLTGKSSPAFPDKVAKKKLNAKLVEDIVTYVADRCKAQVSAIRTSITTKCADEAKMMRIRQQKSRQR